MKKRRFIYSALHHIYQKGEEGFIVFYSDIDFIVFITIFMSVSGKYGIIILAFCPMVEHFHAALSCTSKEKLSGFLQESTSKYALEYNDSLHREKGRIFPVRFGCAPKRDAKAARSLIAYVNNNAPERKLCQKAEDYRWNMLAYARSSHPFSDPIVLSKCSKRMRRAINLIKGIHSGGGYLGYKTLESLFKCLTDKEKDQLIDFILHLYCVIDFEEACKLFGDYESMLLALKTTKGKDFELKEEWTGYSDKDYKEMKRLLDRVLTLDDPKKIQLLPEEKRRALFEYLNVMGRFHTRQIEKYLHIKKDVSHK